MNYQSGDYGPVYTESYLSERVNSQIDEEAICDQPQLNSSAMTNNNLSMPQIRKIISNLVMFLKQTGPPILEDSELSLIQSGSFSMQTGSFAEYRTDFVEKWREDLRQTSIPYPPYSSLPLVHERNTMGSDFPINSSSDADHLGAPFVPSIDYYYNNIVFYEHGSLLVHSFPEDRSSFSISVLLSDEEYSTEDSISISSNSSTEHGNSFYESLLAWMDTFDELGRHMFAPFVMRNPTLLCLQSVGIYFVVGV